MKVGKSGVVKCDHCEKVVAGEPDVFTRAGEVRHFCQGICLDGYFLELYRDLVNKEVDRRTKEENNLIHKQVCPACRQRLRNLL